VSLGTHLESEFRRLNLGARAGGADAAAAGAEPPWRRGRLKPTFSSPHLPPPLPPGISRASASIRTKKVCTSSAATDCVAAQIPRSDVITGRDDCNVTDAIHSRMGRGLHRRPGHPLSLIRAAIYEHFDARSGSEGSSFAKFDDLWPVVSAKANFDSVLVPADHVSRGYNDTYYVDADTVLRCHTSAHQAELLTAGERRFLVTGDVYRRDSIDATHYPAFHQMEGVRVFDQSEWGGEGADGTAFCQEELRKELEGLAKHLFGDVEMRWVDAYFPFTEPSMELEIFYQDEWLEVLGCGVMQPAILEAAGVDPATNKAWAFGLGLERLAMVLFGIPDIRLFWSDDERFTKQFSKGAGDKDAWRSLRFSSFSKYPPVFKDVAFWLPPSAEDGAESTFTENNLCEVVRAEGGDLIEEVKLIDEFVNKKTGRTSNCFRVTYRSMERSLTDDEINGIQTRVRERMEAELGVELR